MIIEQQQGSLLAGTQSLTGGTRRDPLLGVIRGDGETIHMLDEDGSFLTLLTGPDAL